MIYLRLLHKGASLCCFRDSASVTYGGMLPSDLTLSALRFILSAKSRQSCLQDCETVDFCNSLCLLALLGDALLVGDEGCETAIGERVLEQTEDSLERAGGYVSTDAHTVDDVLRVADASG